MRGRPPYAARIKIQLCSHNVFTRPCIFLYSPAFLDAIASLAFKLSVIQWLSELLFSGSSVFQSLQSRPQRWSIFQSDGMVNVFFQATIDFNGFSMVLTKLDHHHWMFFEGPTIGVNGFSMVFKILRAMVNNGFDVPLHLTSSQSSEMRLQSPNLKLWMTHSLTDPLTGRGRC